MFVIYFVNGMLIGNELIAMGLRMSQHLFSYVLCEHTEPGKGNYTTLYRMRNIELKSTVAYGCLL